MGASVSWKWAGFWSWGRLFWFRVDVAETGVTDCDFRYYRIEICTYISQNHAQRVRLGNLKHFEKKSSKNIDWPMICVTSKMHPSHFFEIENHFEPYLTRETADIEPSSENNPTIEKNHIFQKKTT